MRSLKRSVIAACAVFACFLSLLISVITYRMYTASMFERYQKELRSVLDNMELYIDVDDMSECLRTGTESEQYRTCQKLFDNFIDTFTDIHYLYISRAEVGDDGISLYTVCSANSSYEKQFEPENVLHLGDWEPGWYDDGTILRFWDIQNGDQDVYFKNTSDWGTDYTLARPLVDSHGQHFAVFCADISISDIDHVIYRNIVKNMAFVLALCLVFTVLLLLWLQYNVTQPLSLLQKSVVDFAARSNEKGNLEELYEPPVLKVKNEISALSDEVTKLSVSMKNYIIDAVSAENVANALRNRVTELHALAYQDSLTRVKNKAAYDKGLEMLSADIEKGRAEFALVIVDLNYSQKVNVSYGVEHGNEYIAGACHIICQVYKRSPVYRIEGDEFAVILQDQNYRDRDKLLDQINDDFITSMHDENTVPWERYSAAVGMSEYRKGDTIEDVYLRAERQMNQSKARMKRVFQQYKGWDNRDIVF